MDMNERENTDSLLRLLPPVLRARGFRLYTRGTRSADSGASGRYVDLWLDGGSAVLGHTPAGVLRALKNTADKGLFTPLPHPQESRFYKALAVLFPGRIFKVYAPGTDLKALLTGGGTGGLIQAGAGAAGLWRPFENGSVPLPDAPPVLIPVLPCSPPVLALDPACTGERPLPRPDLLPPVFLAAATRGVYDLIAAMPERGKLPFPKIMKALSLKGSPWLRRGIYLYLRQEPGLKNNKPLLGELWEGLFRHFLEGGFLIPPSPEFPLILPGVLSPGEEAKLAELLS
jgi:hypothetical protein